MKKKKIIWLLTFLLNTPCFGETQKFEFNYPKPTQLKEIIERVALLLNKNVVLDSKIKAKVTILSHNPMTKAEVYQTFLSALESVGLTTIETGKLVKVVKTTMGSKQNIPTYYGNTAPRGDVLITQVVPLKNIPGDQARKALAQFMKANAIKVLSDSGMLLITAMASKVRWVIDIFSILDAEGNQDILQIVKIEHTEAQNIVSKLQQFQPKKANAKIKMIPDKEHNWLVLAGPKAQVMLVKQQALQLDAIYQDNSGDANGIHVRMLEFAQAKDIAGLINSLKSSKKSSRKKTQVKTDGFIYQDFKVVASQSSNAVLVISSSAVFKDISRLINKLDKNKASVFLDTVVLEVAVDNGFRFKSSILNGVDVGGGAKVITGYEAVDVAPLFAAQATGKPSSSNIQQVADAFGDELVIGVMTGKKDFIPGVGAVSPASLIKMIKSDSSSRDLASTFLFTADNDEARFAVGETVFFKSSEETKSGGFAEKIVKENVDLVLGFKPKVSRDGTLELKMEVELASIISLFEDGRPRIGKRKVKQTISLENRQTAFISGLTGQSMFEGENRVPILGDIPIIGYFFRSSNRAYKKTHLMIFVTPYIIYGSQDLAALNKLVAKRFEGEEQIMGLNKTGNE